MSARTPYPDRVREFFAGVADLFRSFTWWRRETAVMALGLIPAAIAAAILLAALVGVGFGVPPLVDALTGFADGWADPWPTVLRTVLIIALYVGSLFLCSAVFVALTLAIGDPFYERIWRAVETAEGGPVPTGDAGFWRGLLDAVRLVVRGLGASIVAGLIGLIPLVGSVLGPVVGVLLTGRVLADELTSRALAHREITGADKRAVTRGHRARMAGFGAATQALLLIPLLPIIVMPTAVAGSTVLVRRMAPVAAPAPPSRPGGSAR